MRVSVSETEEDGDDWISVWTTCAEGKYSPAQSETCSDTAVSPHRGKLQSSQGDFLIQSKRKYPLTSKWPYRKLRVKHWGRIHESEHLETLNNTQVGGKKYKHLNCFQRQDFQVSIFDNVSIFLTSSHFNLLRKSFLLIMFLNELHCDSGKVWTDKIMSSFWVTFGKRSVLASVFVRMQTTKGHSYRKESCVL